MHGSDALSGALFSYVDLTKGVHSDQPLCLTRVIANEAFASLSLESDALYPPDRRESIPPERLLRAFLLQAVYTIRSEGHLVECIGFDLPLRWFVGLRVDDPAGHATTFTKNGEQLLTGEAPTKFPAAVLAHPKIKPLPSNDHFSVNVTLIETWVSPKSFRPKDDSGPSPDSGRNGEQHLHGPKRRIDTHASATDPDAQPYRKGRGRKEKTSFTGHALLENQNGPILDAIATRASSHSERLARLHLPKPHADRPKAITNDGHKGLDAHDFVVERRQINVTPHVA